MEDQERVGRRDVESIGGVVVAVFTDNLSASRYRRVQERPGFVATQEFIAEHDVHLWTFASNRAARDLEDYAALRRLCIEEGALWRYSGRTYDLTLAADRKAANSDALRSEEFADDISEAVQRGMDLALEDGKAHGKLPRGYRIIRDDRTGKALRREPIPEQAKVILEAAQRVADGESMRAITADFNVAWLEAGGVGAITQHELHRTLVNPTYAGLRTHEGVVQRAGTNWVAILDLDLHHKVREILKAEGRRPTRGSRPTQWLTCIAECGTCQGRISSKTAKGVGDDRRPTTYRCAAGHVSRPVARVDAAVEELLLQLLENPDTEKALAMPDDDVSLDDEVATIETLRKKLVDFAVQAARDGLDTMVIRAFQDEIKAQIADATARMDLRVADPVLRDIVGPHARTEWKSERYRDLLRRREVVRRAVKVTIDPIAREDRFRAPLNIRVRPLIGPGLTPGTPATPRNWK